MARPSATHLCNKAITKAKTVAIGPKAILAMPIENGSAEQYRRYLWEVHRGAEPIEVATKLGVVASKWCRPTREKVMKHLGELVSAIRNGYSLEFQGIGDHGQMLERYAVAKVAGRF
jgi:hypothetical protein